MGLRDIEFIYVRRLAMGEDSCEQGLIKALETIEQVSAGR